MAAPYTDISDHSIIKKNSKKRKKTCPLLPARVRKSARGSEEKKQQEKMHLICPVNLLEDTWPCSSHWLGVDIVSFLLPPFGKPSLSLFLNIQANYPTIRASSHWPWLQMRVKVTIRRTRPTAPSSLLDISLPSVLFGCDARITCLLNASD